MSDTVEPGNSSWECEGKGRAEGSRWPGEPDICLPKISILEIRTYYGKPPGAVNGPDQAVVVPFPIGRPETAPRRF